MDIAALSVMLNQNKVQAGVAVMQLAMHAAQTQGDSLASLLGESAKSLELSVQPHLGAGVDVRA